MLGRRHALLALLAACGHSPPATGGGDDVVVADAAVDAPPPIIEDVHFIGRFDADKRFAWPGTTISTRFDGAAISVELTDNGTNWFEVTIDGVAQTPLQPTSGQQVYPLATGLTAGTHDLVLVKRTESFFGITQFHGFPGATLVPSARPARLIEFIGDSITCGYGVLGVGPTCNFGSDTEAESHAWGAFAGAGLDAAHVSIAYSGIGISRNLDGNTTGTMAQMYLRTFADDTTVPWDFSYTPDVVVINLGTNDFGKGDPPNYETVYVAFVRDQLRARYPSAQILLATSPMLSDSFPANGMHRTKLRAHLDAIVETLGDPRVSVVEIAEQLDADGYGCDYHPNEVTAHKMADAVAAAIRPLTGW